MGAVFITATGTDIGKTYVACGLIECLRRQEQVVDALKPVATGFEPSDAQTSDAGRLLKALGRAVTDNEIARISPWRFVAPLSPDLAAEREGRFVDFEALVEFSRQAMRANRGTLLIEGIGGVMVPLDARHTVLDWMAALGVPVILVAGSYLGSISHTLTCLEVLRRRAVAVHAVIVNETPNSTVTVAQTIRSVAQFADGLPVIALGRQAPEPNEAAIKSIASYIQ